MNNSDTRLLQAALIQTQAQLLVSRFPGLELDLQNNGNYSISHAIDDSFDLDNIAIDDLVVSAKCTIEALEARYGKGGEKIGDRIERSYHIHARPV